MENASNITTTCATCRHWGSDIRTFWNVQTDTSETLAHHTCNAVPQWMNFTYGTPDTRPRGKLVLVEDAEDYHAALLTAPTFGCVLWEAA